MEQRDHSHIACDPSGAKLCAYVFSLRALDDFACCSRQLIRQASQEGPSVGYRLGRCTFAVVLCRGRPYEGL
jgi:hypothetical protein